MKHWWCFIPFTLTCLCHSLQGQTNSSLAMSYWIDTSLVYMNHLKRPNTSSDNIPYGDELSTKKPSRVASAPAERFANTSDKASRTLGLKRFLLGVEVSRMENSSVRFKLRPDANLRQLDGSQETDFDGRSGVVYRGPTPIKFLDTYSISLHLGETSQMTAGVFDEIAPFQFSYNSPLEYGLWTMLPRKFSGIRVRFRIEDKPPPLAQNKPVRGSEYSVWVYQGRGDRAEIIEAREESYDKGPAASDPRLAMALGAKIDMGDRQEVNAVLGREDTPFEEGHINELYLAMAYRFIYKTQHITWSTAIDSRISRERWEGTEIRHATLNQKSISWTNLINTGANFSIAQGLHYGRSEHHLETNKNEKEIFKGWQADLGFVQHSKQNLDISFFLSAESRDSSIAQNMDGFIGKNDSTSYLMRMAFEVQYVLDHP